MGMDSAQLKSFPKCKKFLYGNYRNRHLWRNFGIFLRKTHGWFSSVQHRARKAAKGTRMRRLNRSKSTIRCDTRCYVNLRWKAVASQLNLPREPTTKKWKTKP